MNVTEFELATRSADDTRALASALAAVFEVGDVVALAGDLGAGKTCFVQGAAAGLGVEARITSPTFVLVREYRGRLPVVHTDVYRLERLQDVRDLGDDVMGPDVVTFLEWADAVAPLLPADRLEVDIRRPAEGGPGSPVTGEHGVDGAERRRVTVRAHGHGWADRLEVLSAACADWR